MAIKFTKAVREKVKTRSALLGPSGSGKTYSALLFATGMARELGGRIAFIDTEHERSRVYAGDFDFDAFYLDPPYSPEKYIEAIQAAASSGEHSVLIIDSATHEWSGPGGILDTKSKMPGANDFAKWAKLTPRHDAFIDAIVSAPIHIISTIRGKDQYITEKDANGKTVVRKVGVGAQQRDGFEYEMTCAFLLDMTHVAEAMKDNTHLFENRYEPIKEQDGIFVARWAEKGETPREKKPAPKPVKAEPQDQLPLPPPETEAGQNEIDQWHSAIRDLINKHPDIFPFEEWGAKLQKILELKDSKKLEETYQFLFSHAEKEASA